MSSKYSVGEIVIYEDHGFGLRKGNIKRIITEKSNGETKYQYYIAHEINHAFESLVKEHQIHTGDFILNTLNANLG